MNEAFKQTLLSPVYDVAKVTPLELAHKLTHAHGCKVYLKREDLQSVHSFKLRGAYNKIAQLTESERQKGVITASAGNHAQGVALSAEKLGIKACIVMPRTTPQIKVDAVKNFGADVVQFGDNYSDAYEHSQQLLKETGMTYVHPFDDPLVIAGQGTVGREIIEQLPRVTHVIVPIGGGGLIAGVAQYIKQIRPDVRIIGVEPDDSNAMGKSLAAGKRVALDHVGIFADGVAVKLVGEHTFRLAQQYIDEVVTVTNDQLCAAIKSVFEDTRSILEPAGALAVAALEKLQLNEQSQVVAICSGANMTFERLQFIAERTLIGSGKEALFSVQMPEKPGTLQHFCDAVVNGHSITEFSYRLHSREQAYIFVGVSVSDQADKTEFEKKMQAHGYENTDLSGDDLVKQHIRHMIGGPSSASHERIFDVTFPERPGALADFLQAVGGQWNISLFHYRGQGGDAGNVLIGFEADDDEKLEARLRATGSTFTEVDRQAVRHFI